HPALLAALPGAVTVSPPPLYHFTPSMSSAETLEAIFVQRERLLQRLVDLVRDSVLGEAKHHSLLVGPRGIGKTHLIALLYHRVRAQPELKEQLRIAWLREDEWGVSSFLELLISILRALAAEHPDPALEQRTEALYNLPPAEATEAAVRALREYAAGRVVL